MMKKMMGFVRQTQYTLPMQCASVMEVLGLLTGLTAKKLAFPKTSGLLCGGRTVSVFRKSY